MNFLDATRLVLMPVSSVASLMNPIRPHPGHIVSYAQIFVGQAASRAACRSAMMEIINNKAVRIISIVSVPLATPILTVGKTAVAMPANPTRSAITRLVAETVRITVPVVLQMTIVRISTITVSALMEHVTIVLIGFILAALIVV